MRSVRRPPDLFGGVNSNPTVAIDIRALAPGDEALLINAAVGVFDHNPRKNLTAEFLRDPRHGDQDFVPLVCARNVAQAVSGSRLLVLSECGHFAHIERPDEVLNAIVDFVTPC